MRMNCKLTLLTREMIEDERGITHARRELEGMEDVAVSADETEIIEIEARQQLALAWCTRECTPARAHASDMLVAFVSVLTGHPVGYTEFVRAARSAYEAGISGNELTAALDAPEFDVEGVQRGMFGRASDAVWPSASIPLPQHCLSAASARLTASSHFYNKKKFP